LCCTIHSILLHFLGHISSFVYGFVFRHLAWPATISTTQALTHKIHNITPEVIFIHAEVATESCNCSLKFFTTANKLQINRYPHKVTSP
jgi:hypothetical protein